MKIHVVLGEAGEYEDRRTWMVKGFFDDSAARTYAQECVIAASEYEENSYHIEELEVEGKLYWGSHLEMGNE